MKKSMLLVAMLLSQTMCALSQKVHLVVKGKTDYVITVKSGMNELVKAEGATIIREDKTLSPGAKLTINAHNKKELEQGRNNYTELSMTVTPENDTTSIEVSISGLFKKHIDVKMR